MLSKEYYPAPILDFFIVDMEELKEFLKSWDDAIINDYWMKKTYVDVFMDREGQ